MATKNKTKIAAPVKSMKGQERQYQKELNVLGRELIRAIREEVLPILKAQQAEYVSDGIGDTLAFVFNKLNQKFGGTVVASFAATTASGMVESVGKKNQKRFERTVGRATGVDLSGIISAEGLEDFKSLQISKNVSLIKSLPQEYLKQVETIVNNGVINGTRFSTIAKEIVATQKTSVNRKLANRIKTIARNEVSTINAQISKRRSEALGVKKGIWRTAEDERVRGNPSGLYPSARPSHFKANGQEFDLNKGLFVDGEWIFPGIPINCRCSFSPVIEVDA